MKHAARSRRQICDNIAARASGLAQAAIYGARLNFLANVTFRRVPPMFSP